MQLSKRVQTIAASPTLAIAAKSKELKDAGHDVIGLGVGEPDINTPDYIIQAAKDAIDEGMTKYTPSGENIPLKQAIIKKMKKDHGLTYKPSEVIVITVAMYALYVLFQSIIDEGDEVSIPTPFWVIYREHVKLAGGVP